WLVLMSNNQIERVQQVTLCKQQFVMLSAYLSRDSPRVWQLARIALVLSVVSDRKCPDRLPLPFGKQRSVRARIDSAREKHAHRHVADFPQLHRGAQLRQQPFRNFFLTCVRQWLRVIPDIPVSRFANLAVLTRPQPCPRRELANPRKQRLRCRRRVE